MVASWDSCSNRGAYNGYSSCGPQRKPHCVVECLTRPYTESRELCANLDRGKSRGNFVVCSKWTYDSRNE